MDATEFLSEVIQPNLTALAALDLGRVMPDSPGMRLQLLVTAGQESAWVLDATQDGSGIARGPFEFEEPTIALMLRHHVVGPLLIRLCSALGIEPTGDSVYEALPRNPLLAVGVARMNYFASPLEFPELGDEQGSWRLYVTVWRPGAVTEGGERAAAARQRFGTVYAQSLAAIRQAIGPEPTA